MRTDPPRRLGPPSSWSLALALALVAGSACSLAVEVDGPPRCAVEVGALDPCPGALRCHEGACVPCDPDGPEVCANGKDDDCDGRVDEGVDTDGDGFATCAAAPGLPADCDDASASAVPGGVERCDGEDGDCDGVADDDAPCPLGLACVGRRCVDPFECRAPYPTACGADAVCAVGPERARCEERARCTADACGAAECDAVSGTCLTRAGGAEAPCDFDGECSDGAACELDPTGVRLCRRACSADDDCGPTEVCWAAPDGRRACTVAATRGLVAGPHGVGDCATGAECRSGVCAVGSCVVRCAADADCARLGAGATCAVAPDPALGVVGVCIGPSNPGAPCASGANCASGVCLPRAPGERACAPLCGAASGCADAEDRCGPVVVGPLRAAVTVCRRPGAEGVAPAGAPCAADADCLEGLCVDGACRPRCARAADCAAPARCRAVVSGAFYELGCVPPPTL